MTWNLIQRMIDFKRLLGKILLIKVFSPSFTYMKSLMFFMSFIWMNFWNMSPYLSVRSAGSSLTLEVISGPSRGDRCSISSTNTSRLPLTLGRVSPSDLLVKDSEVSGKHALINWNLNVNLLTTVSLCCIGHWGSLSIFLNALYGFLIFFWTPSFGFRNWSGNWWTWVALMEHSWIPNLSTILILEWGIGVIQLSLQVET